MPLKSHSMISSGFRNFARKVGSGLNVIAGSRDNVASSETTLSLRRTYVDFMATSICYWSISFELERRL